MIQKRLVILSVILLVALNLTISVGYAAWNHTETWNFQLTTETFSWHHAGTWNRSIGQSPSILALILVVAFTVAVLMAVIYAKRKHKKEAEEN